MDHPANEITRESQPQTAEMTAQAKNIEDIIVPVLKEEIEVHKERRKTGTVRVSKTVHEVDEVVQERLASESVDVQRIRIDQIVDRMPEIRTEGDVTIVPVVKEEIVITKQLRLVEELRLTKRRSVSDYKDTVKVLAEQVTVERVGPENVEAEPSTTFTPIGH